MDQAASALQDRQAVATPPESGDTAVLPPLVVKVETAVPVAKEALAETTAAVPSSTVEKALQIPPPATETTTGAEAVSEDTLLALGMSYLARGARNLEAAHETALSLRKEFEKASKRHRNIKLAALAAESLLMAYYGYGAIEHYTGYQGSTEAILTNSAISGGISVTRAGVQYGLMKRGEEAFKAGDKMRGVVFTGIGLGLALINSLFVAVGFANKYVTQEQHAARQELDKLFAAEAQVHTDKTAALQNTGQIADINAQMNKLAVEIDTIRNHPNFNDGKETEWDKAARADMSYKTSLIETLTHKKDALLQASEKTVDAQFQPQLDALKTSRALWEAKLGGAAQQGDSFGALKGNPTILIEALANVAAISVANWWAATEGFKQENIQRILSGAPEDPWSKADNAAKEESLPGQSFMGYDCSADGTYHLRNELKLNALSQALNNPEAMRAEMKAEITRQHAQMVKVLNEAHACLPAQEYGERLASVNGAYKRALDVLKDDDILHEISRVMADVPKGETLPESEKIPVFSNPDDPKFKALPKGIQFKTKDGQLRVKI